MINFDILKPLYGKNLKKNLCVVKFDMLKPLCGKNLKKTCVVKFDILKPLCGKNSKKPLYGKIQKKHLCEKARRLRRPCEMKVRTPSCGGR